MHESFANVRYIFVNVACLLEISLLNPHKILLFIFLGNLFWNLNDLV